MPRALVARFEHLANENVGRSEWIKFSVTVLDRLVKQQALVMELHRELLSKPSQLAPDDYEDLRARAREGVALANRLADLYQLVQLKIRSDA